MNTAISSTILSLRHFLLKLSKRVFLRHARIHFGQHAEDEIIRNLIEGYDVKVYVDVGSNEPVLRSNTFGLYCSGWCGITIDPNRDLLSKHQSLRPRDIAICSAVSDSIGGTLKYYRFADPEVNTISARQANEWKEIWGDFEVVDVPCSSLQSIIEEYWGEIDRFGLLSIDVEGAELGVLRSMDFELVRPMLLVVEIHEFDIMMPFSSCVARYLLERDYEIVAAATTNVYFRDLRSAWSKLRQK